MLLFGPERLIFLDGVVKFGIVWDTITGNLKVPTLTPDSW